MRYKRVALEVDAVKYEPGKELEDGFEQLSKVIINGWVVTERLIQIKGRDGSIMCPFITNKRGRIFIGKDDYIITEQDGNRHVCSESSFKNRFMEC